MCLLFWMKSSFWQEGDHFWHTAQGGASGFPRQLKIKIPLAFTALLWLLTKSPPSVAYRCYGAGCENWGAVDAWEEQNSGVGLWRINSPVLRLHNINKTWGAWRLCVRQTTFTLGALAALRCRGGDQPGCKFWWSMHVYLITGKSKYRLGRHLLCCVQDGLGWNRSSSPEKQRHSSFFFLRGWAASVWREKLWMIETNLKRPEDFCSDTEEKDGRTF